MAKQKFTIAHDVRIGGQHVKAGSPIELSNDHEADVMTLHNLLASNRVVEIAEAHKHLGHDFVPEPEVPPEKKPTKKP